MVLGSGLWDYKPVVGPNWRVACLRHAVALGYHEQIFDSGPGTTSTAKKVSTVNWEKLELNMQTISLHVVLFF